MTCSLETSARGLWGNTRAISRRKLASNPLPSEPSLASANRNPPKVRYRRSVSTSSGLKGGIGPSPPRYKKGYSKSFGLLKGNGRASRTTSTEVRRCSLPSQPAQRRQSSVPLPAMLSDRGNEPGALAESHRTRGKRRESGHPLEQGAASYPREHGVALYTVEAGVDSPIYGVMAKTGQASKSQPRPPAERVGFFGGG